MSKSIDWATSRTEMLLVGIFGGDWRSRFGVSRKGNVVTNLGDQLLYRLAGALREVAALGPRTHECNHPTDEALCDKLEYLQSLMDDTHEANLKWFWCTRCGALGEALSVERAASAPRNRIWRVEWRRPEAPLSPEPLVNGTTYRVIDSKLCRIVDGVPPAINSSSADRDGHNDCG